MPEPNPYESPREAPIAAQLGDGDPEVAQLRRRVEALEKRLASNWLVSQSRILRILGATGYFVLAYALICVIAFSVMGLIALLAFLFGQPNPF
jgi:hypothetical protein